MAIFRLPIFDDSRPDVHWDCIFVCEPCGCMACKNLQTHWDKPCRIYWRGKIRKLVEDETDDDS